MTAKKPSIIISLVFLLLTTGAVYGVGYVGMLLMRGKSAVELFKERMENGTSLNGRVDFPTRQPKAVPLNARWKTTQEMIAAAPKTELVELRFEHDGLTCTMQAPADAKYDNGEIILSPTLKLDMRVESYDMPAERKNASDWTYKTVKQMLFANDDAVVIELAEGGARACQMRCNHRSGYVDLRCFLEDPAGNYELHTADECALAMKCIQSLKVDEPELSTPMDVYRHYKVRFIPDDAAAPADVTELIFPDSATAALFELVDQFSNVQKLRFNGTVNREQDYQRLAKLKKLTELVFKAGPYEASHYAAIGKLTQLKRLKASAAWLEKSSPIGNLTKLTRLSISPNAEGAPSFPYLANMNQLEELHVEVGSGRPAPGALANIFSRPKLKRLSLEGDLDDAHLTDIQQCTGLTYLAIAEGIGNEDTRPTDKTLTAISKLKSLKSLHFALNEYSKKLSITNKALGQLTSLPLEELTLENITLGDELIDHVVDMPDLTFLHLHNTKVTGAGLARLSELPNLKTLWLISNKEIESEAQTAFEKANPEIKVVTWDSRGYQPDPFDD